MCVHLIRRRQFDLIQFNGTIRSYVLVRLAQFFLDGHHVGTTQGVPLWSYLRDPLLLFQSAALLEVSAAASTSFGR